MFSLNGWTGQLLYYVLSRCGGKNIVDGFLHYWLLHSELRRWWFRSTTWIPFSSASAYTRTFSLQISWISSSGLLITNTGVASSAPSRRISSSWIYSVKVSSAPYVSFRAQSSVHGEQKPSLVQLSTQNVLILVLRAIYKSCKNLLCCRLKINIKRKYFSGIIVCALNWAHCGAFTYQ